MHHNMMGQRLDSDMMGQDMRSSVNNMHSQSQAFGPNQYFVKDDFGNYVYSYNDQQSEKSEENNGEFTKGHYAYIMSNGVKRRVDYIADDNGFHIIRDNADPARIKRQDQAARVKRQDQAARIKRSSEPDFFKMTSVMDSSSLRDPARDMYRMSSMGRGMSSQIDRNMAGMDQQRYSMMDRNLMGQDSMGRQMMGQDSMGHNMMGRDNMMDRNMMDRNMMGQDSM